MSAVIVHASIALSILHTARAVNGTSGIDFSYFMVDGAQSSWFDEKSGTHGYNWLDASLSENERNDMVLFPPSVTKFTVPVGGQYPATDKVLYEIRYAYA